MERTTNRRDFSRLVCLVAATFLLVGFVAFPSVGHPMQDWRDDEYPTTAGAAMRFYEGWTDNWTRGPAEMFLTSEEREIWEALEDAQQREEFIKWFWDRRDPDGRQVGNKFKEAFYENVAESNRKYRGIPKGWRSDRGRVHVMFGESGYVSRRSSQSLFGRSGAEFEVWTYYNLGTSLAFQSLTGEFLVYFIETSMNRFEIYDFQFGRGVWDRNMRWAMDYTIEDSIVDPIMKLETGESSGSYVREIVDGTLSIQIPLETWGESRVGSGGMVSVPVQVRLSDLLFQPDGGQFVATLETSLTVGRVSNKDDFAQVSGMWEIRLGEAELLAVGNGSLVSPVTVAVEPGEYQARLKVLHPLPATEAEWNQLVEVTADPAIAIVVGHASLPLDSSNDAAVGVLISDGVPFDSGGLMVIGAWTGGLEPNIEALAVQLETSDGQTLVLNLEEVRWLGGIGGPLLVNARIPEVSTGDYRVRVDFGDGLEATSVPVKVAH